MVGLVLAVALAAAVALVWLRRRRHHRRAPVNEAVARQDDAGLTGADVADLEARFAAVEADEAPLRDRRLAASLGPLVARRVPARVVEAVPALHAARLRFADGTTVLVRGTVPGNVATLAIWARRRALIASSCSAGAGGTQLVLTSPPARKTVSVVVTGLDQPD